MPNSFEGNRKKRDFLTADSADIDNGEIKAHIDLFQLRINLSQGGMSQPGITAVMRKLEQYVAQVEAEKAKGVHLGSSSLAAGLSSEIFTMPPQELGMETQNEVRLVAMLVDAAIRESK